MLVGLTADGWRPGERAARKVGPTTIINSITRALVTHSLAGHPILSAVRQLLAARRRGERIPLLPEPPGSPRQRAVRQQAAVVPARGAALALVDLLQVLPLLEQL